MLSVTLAMIHGQLLYVYIQEAKGSPKTPLHKKAKKQGMRWD